jgi:hypothetical protein
MNPEYTSCIESSGIQLLKKKEVVGAGITDRWVETLFDESCARSTMLLTLSVDLVK